ncbi:aromatic ring-hydroxylating oxygenase subunit alpha [Novosphingobium aerophilum]|nr:aromatic ring-hydroxylating dioxygenase subunit alpha [Novosphingobium aerophilum]
MLNLIRTRKSGHALPQPFYTDLDFFNLDMELIWYRDWLFAGHNCELPKTGSYFTLQIGSYPVVVLRDKEGEIRAFHNSCRHRGSRICAQEKGTTPKLVCPYHQWTYNLDGKLAFARQMGADFDPNEHALKPVACETAGGYIFINLAVEPVDFAPFRALMAPYFTPHNLVDAKVAHESTIIEKGNWKLVWENNRECYHCAGSHPELCKTYSESPNVTGVSGGGEDPDMAAHWQRCEAAGLPSRFNMHDSGQFRAIRAPLLRDADSYTMTGRSAVQRNLSDAFRAERIGALMMFHYPSTWNHVLIDHAVTFRVTPIGPNETAVTTKWLVHKDAVEGVDYQRDELTHVWNQTNDQDRRIVEENAFGIRSPAYEPGPYSELQEGGVLQFVNWYTNYIEPRLLDAEPNRLRKIA